MEKAVERIHSEIRALGMAQIESQVRGQKTCRLCDATEEEWLAFAESVDKGFQLSDLTLIDGGLYAEEPPSLQRRNFKAALAWKVMNPTRSAHEYLDCRRPSQSADGPLRCADLNFGPFPEMAQYGARVPEGVETWGELHTLLAEAGVQRGSAAWVG